MLYNQMLRSRTIRYRESHAVYQISQDRRWFPGDTPCSPAPTSAPSLLYYCNMLTHKLQWSRPELNWWRVVYPDGVGYRTKRDPDARSGFDARFNDVVTVTDEEGPSRELGWTPARVDWIKCDNDLWLPTTLANGTSRAERIVQCRVVRWRYCDLLCFAFRSEHGVHRGGAPLWTPCWLRNAHAARVLFQQSG